MQALQCLQNWNAEGLAAAQKHLTIAQSELASMNTTRHTSDTPMPGFHPDVNRRLLGPLPPRPVQVRGQAFTIICDYSFLQQCWAPAVCVQHRVVDANMSRATYQAHPVSVC